MTQEQDLWTIFLEEARDLVDSMALLAQEWHQSLEDATPLELLKRDLHTLKGSARMVHQSELSTLAHVFESVAQFILENDPKHGNAYALFNIAIARMRLVVDALVGQKPLPAIEDLIEQATQLMRDLVCVQEAMPLMMVVDDSRTVRAASKQFLEKNNYQVMTAEDGQDALEQIEAYQPDLILLDLEMPRLNGFELAQKLQNHPVYAQIPIIMITCASGAEQKKKAQQLGIKKFIQKPYQEAELLASIQLLLKSPT